MVHAPKQTGFISALGNGHKILLGPEHNLFNDEYAYDILLALETTKCYCLFTAKKKNLVGLY